MKPNVENFIGCDSDYAAAKIVLYGAPFDSTTSFRPGARFGPAAMRHESFGLETYSPYQDADLTDCAVFDSGDMELCFGSRFGGYLSARGRDFGGRKAAAAVGRRAPCNAGRCACRRKKIS